jgi:hypothetical protein
VDETEETYQIKPARMNFADFLVAGMAFAKGVAEAAHDAWEILEMTFAAHSASIMEKQEFERSAGRDIEAMTKAVERDG